MTYIMDTVKQFILYVFANKCFVIISCENETAYERKKGERNRLNLVLN